METIDQAEKKHGFFSIFLIIVYAASFLLGFQTYSSPAMALGPFALRGAALVAYGIVYQAIQLAMIVGMARRTNWIFVLALVYHGYGIVMACLNKFLFAANSNRIMEEALDRTPENPMFSRGDLLGITKAVMNVTFVLSLLFTGLLILFLFLARKNFEKKRII